MNIEDRKNALRQKLAEITEKKNGDISAIRAKSGNFINISSNYDVKKFKFSPGDCIFTNTGELCICAGHGKGSTTDGALWALDENDPGITFFDQMLAADFERRGFKLA